VPDALLSTAPYATALRDWLATGLASTGAGVFIDEPPAGGPTPFVVFTLAVIPSRARSLAAGWDLAELRVTAWCVHDSKVQASALADIAASLILLQLPAAGVVPGLMDDILPTAAPDAEEIAGVAQAMRGWTIPVQRV
jgi:hypothetical protein